MLVFIDESGDAGIRLQKGSSETFTVTMVVIENQHEANRLDTRIDSLKREMGKLSNFEFKFSKLERKHKLRFLSEIAGYNFSYLSVVINKKMLTSEGFNKTDTVYKYTCKLVLENARHFLVNARVVIDGSGSREFRQQLETYLKRKINDESSPYSHIQSITMRDSKENNLLQLADMICGAVSRSFKSKTDSNEYRKLIKRREKCVRFWPSTNGEL